VSGDVRTKMRAERTAPLRHQDLDIPSGLNRLDYAERIFLVRHQQIEGVVARDLQDACVRAALVSLSR